MPSVPLLPVMEQGAVLGLFPPLPVPAEHPNHVDQGVLAP